MKVLLAKTVTDQLASGHQAMEAAARGIQTLAEKVNGLGGVITIDRSGQYGWAYNTPKMAFAYYDLGKQQPVAAIRGSGKVSRYKY